MVTLNLGPIKLNTEDFQQLCYNNPSLKLELTATGNLVVMTPTGGESGIRNSWLTTQLTLWARQNGTGVVFYSSTMFQLPGGSFRSPDAAWISLTRWNLLSEAQKRTFPPICPDLVIELRSPSDSLKELRDKMKESQDNGAVLGWLIDPTSKTVEIYRQGESPELLNYPSQLSGENLLIDFVLDLEGIL
ncbi:MAG: Uma2 family endonuclease [Gloeocapsa sp. DLM2.Bin57]|nr:MAG: Uma2 family endonuclease [Gloeocapsa sp. DLM2.Bin57]